MTTVPDVDIVQWPVLADAAAAAAAGPDSTDGEWAGFIATCMPMPDGEPLRALEWARLPVMLSF